MKPEYQAAIQELKIAEDNLNNADNNYIDAAILQYNAALAKVNSITKEMKGESNQ